MTEAKAPYTVATTLPTHEPNPGHCPKCDWPFGKQIRVRWRDRWREALVLYGAGYRVYDIEVECPSCHQLYCFHG